MTNSDIFNPKDTANSLIMTDELKFSMTQTRGHVSNKSQSILLKPKKNLFLEEESKKHPTAKKNSFSTLIPVGEAFDSD